MLEVMLRQSSKIKHICKSVKIGFWYNVVDYRDSPLPKANTATDEEVIKMLSNLDIFIKHSFLRHFKGNSICRICDCDNESGEYVLSNARHSYTIPEGLRHYIVEHRVLVPELIDIKFK